MDPKIVLNQWLISSWPIGESTHRLYQQPQPPRAKSLGEKVKLLWQRASFWYINVVQVSDHERCKHHHPTYLGMVQWDLVGAWYKNLHMVWSGIFTMKHMKLVVDYVTLSFPISCQRILCDGLEPLTCMIGVQRSKYGCSKLITINHILGNLGKEKNISSSYTCMSKDGVWQIIGFNSCLNNLTRNTWPKDLGALNLWKNISQLILETGDSEKEVVCQRPGFSNADHEMKQNPQVHLYSCCSSIYVWFN